MTINRVEDFKKIAKQKLPQSVFDYIDGAAFNEITRKQNETDLDKIRICPRILNATPQQIAAPIMIGPTAFHQLVHPDGELATARAAQNANMPMIVSIMSSIDITTIAEKSAHQQLWLQLYVFKDKALTLSLINQAIDAGYKAIMLTVGSNVSSRRYRDLENNFLIQDKLKNGNFSNQQFTNISHFTDSSLKPNPSWRDIEWLKSNSSLPIYLKGILHPEDAKIACQNEVSGLVVSNHGGRQLDSCVTTIQALPEIVNAVSGQVAVLIDSGFKSGQDIFKAYALGADCVLIGKSILWALAVCGKQGVEQLVKLLNEEFNIYFNLSGCKNLSDVRNTRLLIEKYAEKING